MPSFQLQIRIYKINWSNGSYFLWVTLESRSAKSFLFLFCQFLLCHSSVIGDTFLESYLGACIFLLCAFLIFLIDRIANKGMLQYPGTFPAIIWHDHTHRVSGGGPYWKIVRVRIYLFYNAMIDNYISFCFIVFFLSNNQKWKSDCQFYYFVSCVSTCQCSHICPCLICVITINKLRTLITGGRRFPRTVDKFSTIVG